MKKQAIFYSIITAIIPSTLAISCAPNIIIEPEFIAIPSKIVEQVYRNTIKDFENFLIGEYGNDINPKLDFYSFEYHIENKQIIKNTVNKLNYFFEINKRKFLQNVKYKADDIYFEVVKKEENYNCLTLDGKQCAFNNIYSLDENKIKIGDYHLGNFSIIIFSKLSDEFTYTKNIVYPVKNYWIDKKSILKLWDTHNSFNKQQVEFIFKKNYQYTIPNFLGLEPEDYSLQAQFDFIEKTEDIFGNWYWEMKKSKSLIYKNLSNSFIDITPYNSKYNFKNFYKKNPNKGFCEITASENPEVDKFHYCGQFETIKNKLINHKISSKNNNIDMYINVNLNSDYLGILEPSITDFTYKFFFGSFLKLSENIFIYHFDNLFYE
ncbi:hypothetical protein [Spiroplasma cantharicola]|uniref:Lipoprotein n=1 Tax=Spiroplasma cantharicola TaxID=362837 RepID=A0A0M5KCD1_9MOLU|nr:hypothetical protein [Spiroplasma cantharicola]ALD66331.1 hypothetical protein SCANT_v1c04250 [Spiroplasma cantharicola]